MYQRTQRGPRLDRAFRVESGLIVVVGLREDIVLPHHAIWPGLSALPVLLREQIQPLKSLQTEFAEITAIEPTGQEIAYASALITAQLLRSGRSSNRERLRFLNSIVPVESMSRRTSAALVGTHPTVVGRELQTIGGL